MKTATLHPAACRAVPMPAGRASGSPTPSPETGGLEGSAGRRAGGRRGPRRGFAGASPTPGAFEHLVLCSPAARVPCWGTFPRFFTSRGLFSDCRVRVPYTVQIQDFRQKRTLQRFSPSPWLAFHPLHSVFWEKKETFLILRKSGFQFVHHGSSVCRRF